MNYERDFYIDHTALDVEWLEQASLAAKWGYYFNECKEEFTRAEENVKVVRSELILLINQDPDKYLGEGIKPTDAKVEAAVRTHKKHLAAKERWIKAMKTMNDAEVAKNEMSFTRKAALENLVTLHGQQYFAGPKMPRDLNKEFEDRNVTRKVANKKVNRQRLKRI